MRACAAAHDADDDVRHQQGCLQHKITVPMWPHSQRSRKNCTGVMKPNFLPSAHSRVPISNIVSGMMSALEDAISHK